MLAVAQVCASLRHGETCLLQSLATAQAMSLLQFVSHCTGYVAHHTQTTARHNRQKYNFGVWPSSENQSSGHPAPNPGHPETAHPEPESINTTRQAMLNHPTVSNRPTFADSSVCFWLDSVHSQLPFGASRQNRRHSKTPASQRRNLPAPHIDSVAT